MKTMKKVAKKAAKQTKQVKKDLYGKTEQNPNIKRGREINPDTGCAVGSKGDLIGKAMLTKGTPAEILAAVTKVTEETWTNKKPNESELHRKAMSWIDYLHEKHPTEFKSVPAAIEMSKATRAEKHAKAEAAKPPKAPKAEKKPAAPKAKKAVKKPAKAKAEVSTQAPETGSSL